MDKKLPVLSKRLKAIVSMVSPMQRVADVGCDHGYTSIWLCNSGACLSCIASDVNAEPLERAKENAGLYGAKESIDFRLGSGLDVLKPGEADCAVITGMGGLLIKKILQESPEVVYSLNELVLSPQSDAYEVRRYLESVEFNIKDEAFVFEDGKYYPVIKAVRGCAANRMSEAELMFGPVLLKRKDKVLAEYLKKRKEVLTGILDGLEEAHSETAATRKMEVRQEINLINDCCIE